MTTITPFLWFDDGAEEAISFYTALFPDARIIDESRDDKGRLFYATFEVAGQRIMALNGGPLFRFTEVISLFVSVKDQAEVDRYWDALIANGGEESQCGWLKDRWGLSWQIVPEALMRYQADPDREKANRVTQAMLKMRKIIVADLDAAAAAAPA